MREDFLDSHDALERVSVRVDATEDAEAQAIGRARDVNAVCVSCERNNLPTMYSTHALRHVAGIAYTIHPLVN